MTKFLVALTTGFIISIKSLIAQSLPANQLIIPHKTFTIPFQWQGDSIHSTWEAHAALLIPVRLKNSPRTFYMQFDLGSPYSLLYKNKIDAIKAKYPEAFPLSVEDGKLKNFSFKAGKTPIAAREIVVKQFDSATIAWEKKKGIEIIGTIGADFIDGKVVMIDYPNKTISLSDSLTQKSLQQIPMTDFMYTNRRVLLPAKINDKKTILYFDTGSSMFGLLTNKETSLQLAVPDAKPVQYHVESWGKILTANTLASDKSIAIADQLIPIHSSTYIEGVSNSQVEQMLKMGIGGMTGNKLFLNYILVLDTKKQKFGLFPLHGVH